MNTKHWILFAILFFFSGVFNAQSIEEIEKMSPEQRKEYINKLSPRERKNLIERYRENTIIKDLELPQNKQEEFRTLYKEYQESQSTIINRAKSRDSYQDMSEKQAQDELEKNFSLGQQLMDNRKKYMGRFQKIMTPQQVLKVYDTEAMMREKMIERRRFQSRPNESPRSNQRNTRSTDSSRWNNNQRMNNNTNAPKRSVVTPQRNSTPQRSVSPQRNRSTSSSSRLNSRRR